MAHTSIHIEISGTVGAGKSELLRIIGAHLQSLGFNVAGVDGDLERRDGVTEIIESFEGVKPLHNPKPYPVLITARNLRVKEYEQRFAGERLLPKKNASFRRFGDRLLNKAAQ